MSVVYIRFLAHEPGGWRRAPLLERLLARAADPVDVSEWRGEAYRAVAPGHALPTVAGAALAAAGCESAAWGCIASPVHCVAGMTAVTLPRSGRLTLESGEAGQLAGDFRRALAGSGCRLIEGRAGTLICAFEQALEVVTHDPEAVAGGEIFGFLPAGPDGAGLRRLMTEIEMWLFEHEVNRRRIAAGVLPLTGLWLWGGGAPTPSLPVFPGWTAGRDPLFAAVGDGSGAESVSGSGVLVLDEQPGSERWPEIERRWLAPAAAALAHGSVKRLLFSAGDRCVSVSGGYHWRWWRRPRPWWERFGWNFE